MGILQNGTWCHGFGSYGGFFSTTGGITMGIAILLVVGILVYLLVSRNRDRQEFQRFSFGSQKQEDTSQALSILSERFARGEINEETYHRMKQQIHDQQ